MKRLLGLAGFIVVLSIFQIDAQTRNSVSASEVNGTFRSYFTGKYKDSYNEVKILSIGRGELRVSFELVYPYVDGMGEMSANMGEAEGTATIEGDTAVYSSDEFGQCQITIKFVKPAEIEITQEGSDSDCGFGHNVTADGTYKKTSSVKPKF